MEEGRCEKGQKHTAGWGQYGSHKLAIMFLNLTLHAQDISHQCCQSMAAALNAACCSNIQGL